MTSGMIMHQKNFILENFFFCPCKAWNIENVKFGQNKSFLVSFCSSRHAEHESVHENAFFLMAKKLLASYRSDVIMKDGRSDVIVSDRANNSENSLRPALSNSQINP